MHVCVLACAELVPEKQSARDTSPPNLSSSKPDKTAKLIVVAALSSAALRLPRPLRLIFVTGRQRDAAVAVISGRGEAGLRAVIKLALRGHAIRANSSSIACLCCVGDARYACRTWGAGSVAHGLTGAGLQLQGSGWLALATGRPGPAFCSAVATICTLPRRLLYVVVARRTQLRVSFVHA
jgi:hypothetical protein